MRKIFLKYFRKSLQNQKRVVCLLHQTLKHLHNELQSTLIRKPRKQQATSIKNAMWQTPLQKQQRNARC